MSKFRESGKILITLKVSKNYFSHVYEQKFGQKFIDGVNLVKIYLFGENGQNWVILWAKMRP